MKFFFYAGRYEPELPIDEFPIVSFQQDNWDDHGFKCRFVGRIWLSRDRSVDLGALRIASGETGFRAKIPSLLDELPSDCISLGESIAYYRKLKDHVPPPVWRLYLQKVGDVVLEPELKDMLEQSPIWEKSFMRDFSAQHALARGGVYLGTYREEITPPRFSFSMQLQDAVTAHEVDVSFEQHGGLPHRTMLFIGRNGTGKTKALAGLAYGLMPPSSFDETSVSEMPPIAVEGDARFSSVITISYNAFDEFPLPASSGREGSSPRAENSYRYCGLRNSTGIISLNEIGEMLAEALDPVLQSDRIDILQRVMVTLLGNQLAQNLADEDNDLRRAALSRLSAGQRLILAIFSNVIGFIEEGSILLIDEPETNLHPGLLSSVIAALNEILDEFDSYAIIATHSPILLQQVPSRYVRLFERLDGVPRIAPLSFESFGEDLGELTRMALGLADPERDFTDVLRRLHSLLRDSEEVEQLFDRPLGVPARTYLYGLDAPRPRGPSRRRG